MSDTTARQGVIDTRKLVLRKALMSNVDTKLKAKIILHNLRGMCDEVKNADFNSKCEFLGDVLNAVKDVIIDIHIQEDVNWDNEGIEYYMELVETERNLEKLISFCEQFSNKKKTQNEEKTQVVNERIPKKKLYTCYYVSGRGEKIDGGIWEKAETAKTITFKQIQESFFNPNLTYLRIYKNVTKNKRHCLYDFDDDGSYYLIYPDQCGTPHVFELIEEKEKKDGI